MQTLTQTSRCFIVFAAWQQVTVHTAAAHEIAVIGVYISSIRRVLDLMRDDCPTHQMQDVLTLAFLMGRKHLWVKGMPRYLGYQKHELLYALVNPQLQTVLKCETRAPEASAKLRTCHTQGDTGWHTSCLALCQTRRTCSRKAATCPPLVYSTMNAMSSLSS